MCCTPLLYLLHYMTSGLDDTSAVMKKIDLEYIPELENVREQEDRYVLLGPVEG